MPDSSHPPPEGPSAAALRMRRLRERRGRGCEIVAIEVSDAAIAELLRRGLLRRDELDNPAALAFAIGAALEQLLEI